MLKVHKKSNFSTCLSDYLIESSETGMVYGILNNQWSDDIKDSLLVFDIRYEESILDQIESDYKPCKAQDVFTHQNFWLLPPSIIAELKRK